MPITYLNNLSNIMTAPKQTMTLTRDISTKIILFIIIVLFSASIDISAAAADIQEIKLSSTEIDLLVGTPEGVSEPLDSRRNTISKENQIDYTNFLDDNALTEETKSDLIWEDAEENAPSENQVENQLMDLLAETEELEKTDQILYYNEYEEEQGSSTAALDD